LGKRLAGDEGESELDRQKAAVSVRRLIDKPSGMHHTHLALDPERDAKLWSASSRSTAATVWDPLCGSMPIMNMRALQ
jgi:hypothetical protein